MEQVASLPLKSAYHKDFFPAANNMRRQYSNVAAYEYEPATYYCAQSTNFDTLNAQKVKKTWGERLKIGKGKDEKKQKDKERTLDAAQRNYLQEYRDKYGTLTSGSALSKSMKYAETWLYGSVAVRPTAKQNGVPRRTPLFTQNGTVRSAAVLCPYTGCMVPQPVSNGATVVQQKDMFVFNPPPAQESCVCAEFITGTMRGEGKKSKKCKKCGGARGPVRRAGTVRVTSHTRPALQIHNGQPDPYDMMRRTRLGTGTIGRGDAFFKGSGPKFELCEVVDPMPNWTIRGRSKSLSPSRVRNPSPSKPGRCSTFVGPHKKPAAPPPPVPVAKSPRVPESKPVKATPEPKAVKATPEPKAVKTTPEPKAVPISKIAEKQSRKDTWQTAPASSKSDSDTDSIERRRKSILECDVNPYELISKYLKNGEASELVSDEDVLDDSLRDLDDLSDELSDNVLEVDEPQKRRSQNHLLKRRSFTIPSAKLSKKLDIAIAHARRNSDPTEMAKLGSKPLPGQNGVTISGQCIRIFNGSSEESPKDVEKIVNTSQTVLTNGYHDSRQSSPLATFPRRPPRKLKTPKDVPVPDSSPKTDIPEGPQANKIIAICSSELVAIKSILKKPSTSPTTVSGSDPEPESPDFYFPTFQEYKQQRRKKQVQFKATNDVTVLEADESKVKSATKVLASIDLTVTKETEDEKFKEITVLVPDHALEPESLELRALKKDSPPGVGSSNGKPWRPERYFGEPAEEVKSTSSATDTPPCGERKSVEEGKETIRQPVATIARENGKRGSTGEADLSRSVFRRSLSEKLPLNSNLLFNDTMRLRTRPSRVDSRQIFALVPVADATDTTSVGSNLEASRALSSSMRMLSPTRPKEPPPPPPLPKVVKPEEPTIPPPPPLPPPPPPRQIFPFTRKELVEIKNRLQPDDVPNVLVRTGSSKQRPLSWSPSSDSDIINIVVRELDIDGPPVDLPPENVPSVAVEEQKEIHVCKVTVTSPPSAKEVPRPIPSPAIQIRGGQEHRLEIRNEPIQCTSIRINCSTAVESPVIETNNKLTISVGGHDDSNLSVISSHQVSTVSVNAEQRTCGDGSSDDDGGGFCEEEVVKLPSAPEGDEVIAEPVDPQPEVLVQEDSELPEYFNLDPVEAVRRNLVPHVCGRGLEPEEDQYPRRSSTSRPPSKTAENQPAESSSRSVTTDDTPAAEEATEPSREDAVEMPSTDPTGLSLSRSKFYVFVESMVHQEPECVGNDSEDEIEEKDRENHYEIVHDPIYEEIRDGSLTETIVDDDTTGLSLTSCGKKSIFEGASKYDILSYLVGAKERGISLEPEYDSVLADHEDLDLDKTTSLDLSQRNKGNRISHISNASDSSEDSNVTSLTEASKVRRSSVEVERNDSGVGSETSKSSRSKWQQPRSVTKEDHLCEDCDQPVETQVTESGLMYAPLVCRKCGKKRAERKEIITEIVETEIKYGRDLHIIVEEFYRPMLVAGLLTPDQLAAIFLNVEELIEINDHLTEKLKDALEIALDQGDEDLLTVNMGKLFLEAAAMLHAFESYCTRQGAASMLLANLEKEKELLRIFLRVSQMENSVLRRMNLNSFLMVPVQRVTKYPLLLARLYKVTPVHHEGRELLKEAQQKIELHLEHMNSEAKDISSTKLWRRISNINAPYRRSNSETDIVNIKLRKMALDVLEWNHDEVRFVMEGKLNYTQPTDSNWRKGKTIKLNQVNALLVTYGKPTSAYHPEISDEELLFPKKTGIREATLLLVKEKGGRYSLLREPLFLDKCIVCCEPEWDDCFEVQEFTTKDTYILKADDNQRTHLWFRQLQYHTQGLGAWRRRRNALANIMINGMARN